MGKQPLSADRRAVLSSIALAGLAGAVPAAARAAGASMPAQARCPAWEAAQAAYARADAAVIASDRDHLAAASRRIHELDRTTPATRAVAQRARLAAAYDRAQDRFNDLVAARHDAFARLCNQPAPDLPAVARKVELIVQDDRWECDDIGELLQAVHADLCRLVGRS